MHQRDSCLACLQFRSISYGLFGTEAYHKAVRRKAVQYLREHRSDFEAFLGDDFDHWLKDMSHNDTWGDELTLVSVHPSKWQCQACLVCSNYPMHDRTISHSVIVWQQLHVDALPITSGCCWWELPACLFSSKQPASSVAIPRS